MLKAPSGFNPVPFISLGDSERVLEVYSESVETIRDINPASTINFDDIINKYILPVTPAVMSTPKAAVAVAEKPVAKAEPITVEAEKPVGINLSRIDDRLNQKAQDDLAKLRAELAAEKEKAAKAAEEQAKALAEAKRLAEEQAAANRKAAEEAEQARIEAEKIRVAQEIERQKLAAEIERQRLEAERLKAQQEAEQLKAQLAREKAAAE